MDILNSEGTIIGIEKIHTNYFLKIKKNDENQYAYFPINKNLLKKYLLGEITLRESLIPLDEFSFIDDYYTSISNEMKENSVDRILNDIN
ncbi:MAG: hypothetical protein ACOYOV_14935 [Bacteroidales bacterium]